MGKHDRDRFQKELAVRFCTVRGALPFIEVNVFSASDLSDNVEILTDLDVLGVQPVVDGGLRRTFYDCKTAARMSSVNRAFWAAGVMQYTNCDYAFAILKGKAVSNHRMTALSLNVDLHDEQSFIDLGRTFDSEFPADNCYQAALERWSALSDCYERNSWSSKLFELCRHVIPLTRSPWSAFRRVIAELRQARGKFDPARREHVAMLLDILVATFLLWTIIARDLRKLYEPTMSRSEFETILRYYLWGGKESYSIRNEMRNRTASRNGDTTAIELPEWEALLNFAGLALAGPENVFDCARYCRELSLRALTDPIHEFDAKLAVKTLENTRLRQFLLGMTGYLIAAGKLPADFAVQIQDMAFSL